MTATKSCIISVRLVYSGYVRFWHNGPAVPSKQTHLNWLSQIPPLSHGVFWHDVTARTAAVADTMRAACTFSSCLLNVYYVTKYLLTYWRKHRNVTGVFSQHHWSGEWSHVNLLRRGRPHSSVDIIREYDNICAWSARNKLLSTLIKRKKLCSIGLPLGISIFRLLCLTLNELPKLHYLELTSPLLSQLLRT